ncbi:MAG: putative ABC transporter permease [Acutalibacteraceae bacterium]
MEKTGNLFSSNRTQQSKEETKEKENGFANGLCFDKLVWIFLISCVVGFVVETAWCYLRHGYIESRQSLVYGPLSVAYGMGGVVLSIALYKLRDAPIYKIFAVSFVVGTVTEYICSLGQEIVFGSVAWDYSNRFMNIGGRVCLLYSCFWGILGVIWIKCIYPVMSAGVEKMPVKAGKILTYAFIAFFIFDCIMSAGAGLRMNERAEGLPASNSFEVYLDSHFGDERMHEIYANSKEVEK